MLGEGLSLLYPVKGRTRWFIYSADEARWQASVRFGALPAVIALVVGIIGPAGTELTPVRSLARSVSQLEHALSL
jgi:hypothetical protein